MFSDTPILELLRDFQDRNVSHEDRLSYQEWRIEKQRKIGTPVPFKGDLTGHLSSNGRTGHSQYAFQRPVQPPNYIDDVDISSVWFTPNQPIWPYGPPNVTTPREWNYPVGYNVNYIQPRMELMGQLRAMRASWGILSTLTTTRQDQLLNIPATIQFKNSPRKTTKSLEDLRTFFRRPDGKLKYGPWARKMMFDLFDIDNPCLYVDRGYTGKIKAIEVLDGATIFPLIDDSGRRPDSVLEEDENGVVYLRRQPAYQQIVYGQPMINLSEDEIISGMMRPRPDMPMFGYSPIEQIFIEATEAIRKTIYQLEFWRSGSMPELIITVPDNWTPAQIASFQAHFDALLSGNLSLKSKVRFVPSGMKPFDIKNASGESLWSKRDETLIRLACFAFSIPPMPFVGETNRGTARVSQESAQKEGLFPLMSWWKDDIIDVIIQEKFGYDDIELVYQPPREVDLEKRAKIHDIYHKGGIFSTNQVLEELGREPIPDGDVHLMQFGNAALPLADVVKGKASPQGSQGLNPNQPKPEIKKLSWKDIKDASRGAGEPTKAQREAGNYYKGKIRIHGLNISIENAKGSMRKGDNWEVKMPAPYGYIKGYQGADGDQIDAFLGRFPDNETVWVIDQKKYGSDDFDEHKVMLGYKSLKKALKDYHKAYNTRDSANRIMAVHEMHISEFKNWLENGDLNSPVSYQTFGNLVKFDTISTATNYLSYDQSAKKTKRKKKSNKSKSRSSAGPRWLELKANI